MSVKFPINAPVDIKRTLVVPIELPYNSRSHIAIAWSGGYVCACVRSGIVFWVWSISDSVRFVLAVAPQRAEGVAPAARFQLCVRCAGPCRARGGCGAAVSVASALEAQGAV